MADHRLAARRRLMLYLLAATGAGLVLGLATGSEGWRWSAWQRDWADAQAAVILWDIRLPRTLGAWLVGAALGLAGALAQGLFRNPLADPFLLGSAAGASLGVVLVLAAGTAFGATLTMANADWLQRVGLATSAFVGAIAGVSLTLALARGAHQTLRLLLAGVVVGVMLGALNELLTLLAPSVLRERQLFLLGSTAYIDHRANWLLAAGLGLALPLAWRSSRVLDALTLGEDTARNLGLNLGRWRLALVSLMALSTGLAVSQAGLVAFVGLAAPHLVRRLAPSSHGFQVIASAAAGGTLLLIADVLARGLMAPAELPVGVVTAVLGGLYLLVLLGREKRL